MECSVQSIGRTEGRAGRGPWSRRLTAPQNDVASLRTRSSRLARLGQRDEALAAIEQAIEIRRDRACVDRRSQDAAMAQMLSVLAVRLAQAGRIEDSLTASEQAVAAYERLACAQPAVYEPVLAQRLGNLAVRLAKARRRAEALAASERVVAIHRRLAACNPVGFEPLLWTSLNNHADRLTEAARLEEARRMRAEAAQRRTRYCVHLARPGRGRPHAALCVKH